MLNYHATGKVGSLLSRYANLFAAGSLPTGTAVLGSMVTTLPVVILAPEVISGFPGSGASVLVAAGLTAAWATFGYGLEKKLDNVRPHVHQAYTRLAAAEKEARIHHCTDAVGILRFQRDLMRDKVLPYDGATVAAELELRATAPEAFVRLLSPEEELADMLCDYWASRDRIVVADWGTDTVWADPEAQSRLAADMDTLLGHYRTIDALCAEVNAAVDAAVELIKQTRRENESVHLTTSRAHALNAAAAAAPEADVIRNGAQEMASRVTPTFKLAHRKASDDEERNYLEPSWFLGSDMYA